MNRRSLRLIAVGAAAAVGTALVYFLDPVAGPERRRVARKWVAATVRGLIIDASADADAAEHAVAAKVESETAAAEPVGEPDPLRYSAAVGAAPGQTFSTRLVAAETPLATASAAVGKTALEGAADEAGAVEPGTADATAPRSPTDVVRSSRGDRPRGGGVDPKGGVLYLQGEQTPPSRVVAYDRTGEAEPPLVRPRKRDRLPSRLLAGSAAALAASAVVLASWAVVLELDSEPSSAATPLGQAERRAIALLTEPGVRRVPVQGSRGTLFVIVGQGGKATLVGVSKLGRAPAGKAYEAWVIDGAGPTPAGLFTGTETVVDLTARVPKGATVAVTLERAAGVPAPTTDPIFAAKT